MQKCEIVGSNTKYQVYEDRVLEGIGNHPSTSDITIRYYGVYDSPDLVLAKFKDIVSKNGKYKSIIIRPSCGNVEGDLKYLISFNIEYQEVEEKLTYICDVEDVSRSFGTLNYLHAQMEIVNKGIR